MKLTNSGKMWLYRLYSIIAYIIPMLLCYFIFFFNSKPKVQFGFWGFFVFFLIFIFSYKILTKSLQKTPLMFGSAVLLAFSIVMSELADNVMIVSIFSFIGACLSTIILKVENVYQANSKIAVNGNVNNMQKNPAPALTDKEAWKIAYGVLSD